MYSIVTIFEYSDPRFDIGSAAINELSIHASLDGFSFCVISPNHFQVLYLKQYVFAENLPIADVAHLYSEICYWDEILRVPYQKVRIMVDSNRETLIHDQLYRSDESKELLNTLFCPNDIPQHLVENYIRSSDLWVVVQFPALLHEKLLTHQPQATMFSSSTPICERLLTERYNTAQGQILINRRRHSFQLFITENGKLTFHNTFSIPHPNDLVYFTAYVVDQLNLDADKILIRLIGEIDIFSPEISMLKNYFKNVSLEKNPFVFHGRILEQINIHRYINLFNLSLCE